MTHNKVLYKGHAAFLLVLLLALTGCSSGQHGDLAAYVTEIKSRTKGSIEPLPEIRRPPTVVYAGEDKRDPFTPYEEEPEEDPNQPVLTEKPPRPPEELEQFPLDSLNFVGTLEKGGVLWGLIQAPDKAIYRVQAGNYMGKNDGRIISITENTVILVELIRSGAGFVEREAQLALTE